MLALVLVILIERLFENHKRVADEQMRDVLRQHVVDACARFGNSHTLAATYAHASRTYELIPAAMSSSYIFLSKTSAVSLYLSLNSGWVDR